MQPILTILELKASVGTMGYSYLEKPFGTDGKPQRMTALYVRGLDGYTEKILMVPAETVRGAYY